MVNPFPAHLPNVAVHMIRTCIEPFPRRSLAPGYRFRTYRPEDRATWTYLQRAAEPFFAVDDDLFQREFGDRLDALPDRMFFVETDSGLDVGTITAWWQPDWRECGDWGQIHWVAVHPDYQRLGISTALLTCAMQRLNKSHRRAMLGTSTGRVWALKAYLDFGFYPLPRELDDPEILEAWQQVQKMLRHPLLGSRLNQASSGLA
jgi:GNAT superfamily N-acetyltransferase